MKAIMQESEFNEHCALVSTIIDRSKKVPQLVFKEKLRFFLFVTFDEMLMPVFFEHIKEYSCASNEKQFWLTVIEPNPRTYFYENFGRYNVLLFDKSDTVDSFISALNEFPDESPADAVMHNSNQILVSSNTGAWAVYGDRAKDIGICAFSDEETMRRFERIYGKDLLDGIDSAADYAFGDHGKGELKEEFRRNYSPTERRSIQSRTD